MMKTRRSFLSGIVAAGLGGLAARLVAGVAGGAGLGAANGCAASDPCVDSGALSTGETSLRASFHYVAHSPRGDAKRCRTCRFFRAAADDADGCGDCEILQGPVHGMGHCDSFTERA